MDCHPKSLHAALPAGCEEDGEDWASWRLHADDQAVGGLERHHPL